MPSLNGDLATVRALKAAGLKPCYCTSWVGPWSGASSIDAHLATCKARPTA